MHSKFLIGLSWTWLIIFTYPLSLWALNGLLDLSEEQDNKWFLILTAYTFLSLGGSVLYWIINWSQITPRLTVFQKWYVRFTMLFFIPITFMLFFGVFLGLGSYLNPGMFD